MFNWNQKNPLQLKCSAGCSTWRVLARISWCLLPLAKWSNPITLRTAGLQCTTDHETHWNVWSEEHRTPNWPTVFHLKLQTPSLSSLVFERWVALYVIKSTLHCVETALCDQLVPSDPSDGSAAATCQTTAALSNHSEAVQRTKRLCAVDHNAVC